MNDILYKLKYLAYINDLHFNEVEIEFNNYVEKYNSPKLFKTKNSKSTHIINNMHSVFFYSLYETIGFSVNERKFCGILNNCFRLIITGADNLLDRDDNHYLGFAKIKKSPTMKSIFDILLAEKIIHNVLNDYCLTHHLFNSDKINSIQEKLFECLTGSGINEAEETQKSQINLTPEEIITKVHHYKSGKLFTLPLLPAKIISENSLILKIEKSLYDFGIAVQILDDISDIYEDYQEEKPNYFIALLKKNKELKKLESLIKKNTPADLLADPIVAGHLEFSLEMIAERMRNTFSLLYSLNKRYDISFFKYILKLLFAKLKINFLYENFTKRFR